MQNAFAVSWVFACDAYRCLQMHLYGKMTLGCSWSVHPRSIFRQLQKSLSQKRDVVGKNQKQPKRKKEAGFDCTEDADILFSEGDGTLGQMHQNSTSLYEFSLSHQHLENYPEKYDFLTGLTFGFLAKSEEMTTRGNTLTVKDGTERVTVAIHSLTLTDGDEWRGKIKRFPKSDQEKHKAYWKSVWEKSYVYISGGKDADKITQGYALQRYMNLCGGKGRIFPAFYGPNYDWLPDQDNGANMNMAIAKSLVQENDEKIFLLPAWNKSMDVSFRLPVGKNNFITVVYKKGKMCAYSFDKPEKREVVLC